MKLTLARLFSVTSLALILSACGQPGIKQALHESTPDDLRLCAEHLDRFDQQIVAAGLQDAQGHRLSGFPYLRSTRFLADTPSSSDYAAWIQAMADEAATGTRSEQARLANAPALKSLLRCQQKLADWTAQQPHMRTQLSELAQVPDNYLTWQRALGLYPITVFGIQRGVHQWQDETVEQFATPIDQLPKAGRLVRYAPPTDNSTPEQIQTLLQQAKQHPLGMLSADDATLSPLFDHYAPSLVVDTAGSYDEIGAIEMHQGQSRVNTAAPVMYRHLAHTRFEGQTHLQLVYTFWFPERPLQGKMDLLGGHLDGLVWRVTLDHDGSVLIADTIHNCGCYHLFFPGKQLQFTGDEGLTEETFMPQQSTPDSKRVELYINSLEHYLLRVSEVGHTQVSETRNYAYAEYDQLRALADGEGRTSLFGPDGIVPGTERAERHVLWPMGVPSPGAMRQWGSHATAFVGRRHFDDPNLISDHFKRK